MAATDSSRPIALVTGASGGIGLELAKLFAADGHDLVLVARDRDRLAAVARELESRHGIRATAAPADLADPAAPAALHAALEREGRRVDVLVNNAGFGLCGGFAELDASAQVEMVQVNVAALTHLTRLCLPPMLARRAGGILNVASTAAFQPGPLMAVYYASKAYVLSFSEALAGELAGTGVTVTALCPGPTATGFQSRAGMERSRMLRDLRLMDASAVARAGYRAFRAGRRVVVPGWTNRLLAGAVCFLPRGLVLRVARRLNSQPPE
jgi:short-subunit dehydrogenase